MGVKKRIEDATLYISSVLTALFLSSLPSFAEDPSEDPFKFDGVKRFAKDTSEVAHSTLKDISDKVIGAILMGAALVLMGMSTMHIISQYNRKREMGQTSVATLAGYVALGVVVNGAILIFFLALYKGATSIISKM